jgi:hypothetical protein
MATKRDLYVGLGLGDPGPDTDADSDVDESTDDDREQQEDEAIDAVFDAKDPETRREAFRRAVKLCSESY